ncbi:HRDC-like protein [Mycotypha africana]|uniref:HRDC-like protein n=1 Tax=Mycotypha africana TaxID=64632 RepID=UPI0022FFF116|nr:HRDC-like protein [Mycotypha africana]KAI8970166.1 HRDC-like protein [Mycotypha africana]
MQIKNARSALLSNYEVFRLLEESQATQKRLQKADPTITYPEHLRTVQFELTEYLKETPCSTQTTEQIANFLNQMSPYNLTKAERLMLLNLRPKDLVGVYLVIEECEERFNEEELEAMLNIIVTTLPRDDDDEMEEDGGEEEVEEEE